MTLMHTAPTESFATLDRAERPDMQRLLWEGELRYLDRYLVEFDFRFNNRAKLGINDAQRAEIALKISRQATHVPTA
jgi:hypothetical protein